jgi:hypothetical protein
MRSCSAIHHPGRPTFRVKARFRNGSCTVSDGQGAAMILVASRLSSPGLFLNHRQQPWPTIVSSCTTSAGVYRLSQPSGSSDRLPLQTWNTSCTSRGGVVEHMAADRLHRAMATVFETCSSVLEGWKNAGLTRTDYSQLETANNYGSLSMPGALSGRARNPIRLMACTRILRLWRQ